MSTRCCDRHATATLTLRRLRELHLWTQEYVAEQIGVTRQTIAAWEAGARQPSMPDLQRLAVLYRFPMAQIRLEIRP